MKLSRNALAATTWGKSHQTLLLLALFLVIASLLIGWWSYIDSAQRVSQTTSELPKLALPLVSNIKHSDTAINATNIQSPAQIDSIPTVKTRVQINGQQVQAPQTTGTVQKVIQDPGGTTTVDISVNANSSGNTSTDSSTNIDLNSTSEVNSSSESGQSVP